MFDKKLHSTKLMSPAADQRISDYDTSYGQSIRFNTNNSRGAISTSQSAYRIPSQRSVKLRNQDSRHKTHNTRNGLLNGSSSV
jgi:hypothetical protein